MMFNQYPYLNVNDLNLDYILSQIKIMMNEVTNFVSINAIKYADPIQWDITRQYEKNTVVIDPVTGTAYISVAPVPAGVALTRPEYWTVVFDLGSFVTRAAQNFTSRYEQETTLTATFPSNMGEWLVWGDVLYKALTNITAGDTYVVDGNIEHFTIEDLYNAYLNTIANILALVGDLAYLTTSDTSDIVHAINSVLSDLNNTIGDLTDLNTSDKTSVVNAINDVLNVVDYRYYVTPEMFGAVGDGVTNDTTPFQNAVNTGKPVMLTGNYLLDTITTAGDIIIVGNGHSIINNDITTLFSCDKFIANNVIIVNKEDYHPERNGASEPYATIECNYIELVDSVFENVNQYGVTCHSCKIDNVKVTCTYDINALFDSSSLDNFLGFIWVHQDSTTDFIEISNSYFENLISAIYVGYYYPKYYEISIHNNTFKNLGDHAAYINSYGDYSTSYITNNTLESVGASFAICGNNFVVENNVNNGGFNGAISSRFGMQIRNASNVKVAHNVFILESFITTAGVGCSFLITSLQPTMPEMHDIIFENNVFDVKDGNVSMPFIYMGGNYLTNLNNIKFINNIFDTEGFSAIFYANSVTIRGFEFNDNDVTFAEAFFDASIIGAKVVTNNDVRDGVTNGTFDVNAHGRYENNTFDCATRPLRFNNSDRNFVCNNINNSSAASYLVYNTPQGIPTTIVCNDVTTGEFTATGTAYTIADELLLKAFQKTVIILDSNREQVSCNIQVLDNGRANVSNLPSAGTYFYKII